MINHARTLLLNISPAKNHTADYTVAEYVPPDFTPIPVTPALKLLRRTLFGQNPDARFLNLRVHELMAYLHNTELAEYIYKLDPRVTYWPAANNTFIDDIKQSVVVTQLAGAEQPLNIVGNFAADNVIGRALRNYFITVETQTTDTPDVNQTVAIIRQVGDKDAITLLVGTTDAQTIGVLPDTQLKAVFDFLDTFPGSAMLTTENDDYLITEGGPTEEVLTTERLANTLGGSGDTVETLAKWYVVAKAVPDPAITILMPVLEMLGEPVFLELFGASPVEPYKTFRNLWHDHYSAVYRLAGLTAAIIYRTEELRRQLRAQ